ncbi:MAG: hypothetical protein WCJ75_16415 [Desulfomonile sp.]|jgi:hypothetical protein
MNNIELEITDDDVLVLRIDLKQEIQFTKSNRSIMIGSTQGNLLLWHEGRPDPRNIRVNCSVFRGLTIQEKRQVAEARKSRGLFS